MYINCQLQESGQGLHVGHVGHVGNLHSNSQNAFPTEKGTFMGINEKQEKNLTQMLMLCP